MFSRPFKEVIDTNVKLNITREIKGQDDNVHHSRSLDNPHESLSNDPIIVTVNVGGTIFQAMRSTWDKRSDNKTMFWDMMTYSRHSKPFSSSSSSSSSAVNPLYPRQCLGFIQTGPHEFFVDRSPTVFHLIMTYLRQQNQLSIRELSASLVKELVCEADFYRLASLKHLLTNNDCDPVEDATNKIWVPLSNLFLIFKYIGDNRFEEIETFFTRERILEWQRRILATEEGMHKWRCQRSSPKSLASVHDDIGGEVLSVIVPFMIQMMKNHSQSPTRVPLDKKEESYIPTEPDIDIPFYSST